MSRDVMYIDRKDVIVQEDTANAYRGADRDIMSIAVSVVIIIGLFIIIFMTPARDRKLHTPSHAQNANTK